MRRMSSDSSSHRPFSPRGGDSREGSMRRSPMYRPQSSHTHPRSGPPSPPSPTSDKSRPKSIRTQVAKSPSTRSRTTLPEHSPPTADRHTVGPRSPHKYPHVHLGDIARTQGAYLRTHADEADISQSTAFASRRANGLERNQKRRSSPPQSPEPQDGALAASPRSEQSSCDVETIRAMSPKAAFRRARPTPIEVDNGLVHIDHTITRRPPTPVVEPSGNNSSFSGDLLGMDVATPTPDAKAAISPLRPVHSLLRLHPVYLRQPCPRFDVAHLHQPTIVRQAPEDARAFAIA